MASSKKPPPNGSSATKKKSAAKKKAPAANEQTPQVDTSQMPPQASEQPNAEPNSETPTKTRATRSRKPSQSKAISPTATQPQLSDAPRTQVPAKHPVVLVPSYQPPSAAQASALSIPPATSTPSQQATKKRRRSSANPTALQILSNVPAGQPQTTNKAHGLPQLSGPAPTAQPVPVGESSNPQTNIASQAPPQVNNTLKKESPIPVPRVIVPSNVQPRVRRLSEQSNQSIALTQAIARVPLPNEPGKESAALKQAESRKPLPKERPKQPPQQKKQPAQRQWATIPDQALANPLPQHPTASESMPPPAKKQKVIVPDEHVDQRTGFLKGVVVSSSVQPRVMNDGQNEQQKQVQNAHAIPPGRPARVQNPLQDPHFRAVCHRIFDKRALPVSQLTPVEHKALLICCKAVLNAWAQFIRITPHWLAFKEGKITKEHPLVKDALEKLRGRVSHIPHPFGQKRVFETIFREMMPPGVVLIRPQRPTQIQPPQLPPMNFPGWHHDVPQQQSRQAQQSSLMSHQEVNKQSQQQQAPQTPPPLPRKGDNQGMQQQAQEPSQFSPMNPVGWNSPSPQRHQRNPLGDRLPVMRVEGRPDVPVQVLPPPVLEEELPELVDEPIHESQDLHRLAEIYDIKINLASTGVIELLNYRVDVTDSFLEKAKAKSAKATEGAKAEAKEKVVYMKEELRRTKLASEIFHSLQQNLPHRAKPSIAPPVQLNNKPMPTFQELALGNIKACNPNAGSRLEHCTFCTFDCDYGIDNDWFQLPPEASTGYCRACRAKEVEFYGDLSERAKFPVIDNTFRRKIANCQVKLEQRPGGLREVHPLEVVVGQRAAHELAAQYQLAKPTTHNTISNLDGMDISAYRTLRFCRGCPWTQLDLTKARICGGCKEEKLNILQHRHLAFERVIRDADTTEKDRRCMLCPASAYEKCIQCPLRLCGTCVACVRDGGKGWINNAIYNYDRVHLRNDAFLLRSDGGGF